MGNDLSNWIYGVSGHDSLFGLRGDDLLDGGEGNDGLAGNEGIDWLRGGAGDDTLIGGADDDTMDGGIGTDTAIFSGNRDLYTVTVSDGVTTVSGPDGDDTLTNVEFLQFDDMMTDAAGEPTGASAAAALDGPLTLPPMTTGEKAGIGPEVLPLVPDAEPLVLPSVDGDGKAAGPEVLPPLDDDFVLTGKFEGPPVLPALDDEPLAVDAVLYALTGHHMLHLSDDGLILLDEWSGPGSRDEAWG
ncbi:MAG: hypothetical protein IR159_03165 [Brevundimonas sp.]|nr:hypothetical protein [Brevundimonas sp.]